MFRIETLTSKLQDWYREVLFSDETLKTFCQAALSKMQVDEQSEQTKVSLGEEKYYNKFTAAIQAAAKKQKLQELIVKAEPEKHSIALNTSILKQILEPTPGNQHKPRPMAASDRVIRTGAPKPRPSHQKPLLAPSEQQKLGIKQYEERTKQTRVIFKDNQHYNSFISDIESISKSIKCPSPIVRKNAAKTTLFLDNEKLRAFLKQDLRPSVEATPAAPPPTNSGRHSAPGAANQRFFRRTPRPAATPLTPLQRKYNFLVRLSETVNDQKWNQFGHGFFGHKTPQGIAKLRIELVTMSDLKRPLSAQGKHPMLDDCFNEVKKILAERQGNWKVRLGIREKDVSDLYKDTYKALNELTAEATNYSHGVSA